MYDRRRPIQADADSSGAVSTTPAPTAWSLAEGAAAAPAERVAEPDLGDSPTPGRGGRISFRTAAVVGSAVVALLVILVAAAVLGAFLRIVSIAETARDEVVPAVIQQQEHAVVATDLARVAEMILGARSREDRAAALDEAEAIANRFAQMADTSVLARLDSALHAVRRSAYRADVLDALQESAAGHLSRLDGLLPPLGGPRPSVDPYATQLLFEVRHVLNEAAQVSNSERLAALESRFDVLRREMTGLAASGTADTGGRPFSVQDLKSLSVVFDLRREWLFVQQQVKGETATARRLLAELSENLSADAAATASRISADIVTTGENGILIGGVALGVSLLAMVAIVLFLLRHVVGPVLRAHAALDAVQAGERVILLPPALLREFDRVGRSVERLAQVLNEVKIKERAAQRSQQQLQFVFDVSPVPFLMTRVDTGEVVDANKAACALLRIDHEQLVGRLVKDFWVQPERREDMVEFLKAEGSVDNMDAHLLTASGTDFWAVLSVRLVELDSGLVMLTGLYDITDRKAYEVRLHALVNELAQSNRELEQFAYVASHDLQEPLRMVMSYLQLLQRKHTAALSEEGHEFIGYAVDGARRMERLIIDLLEYSRVGRNATPRPVRLTEVVADARQALRVAIEETDAVIDLPATLPTVIGDAPELTRLFQNLLGNAIKYRAVMRTPRLRISARRDGGQWEIALADNGIGIPADQAERVFQIFQRLHGSADGYPGTGIGLAICRKIVEQHGGRIWIDPSRGTDAAGEGCTVRFTLPDGE